MMSCTRLALAGLHLDHPPQHRLEQHDDRRRRASMPVEVAHAAEDHDRRRSVSEKAKPNTPGVASRSQAGEHRARRSAASADGDAEHGDLVAEHVLARAPAWRSGPRGCP